ncbi:methylated-DNA--protein-cysteine methyltransferase NDAI_0E03340 [Naumovozyma dairenensis CBS 421]|uniref:Methylated-DNA--protein-cysteine methyltransferase n=1 Tax=Naumovozyma dairenensis (strain ATCC 10597 / BCRC 20456 / CBS 421 / NBRC 0211 / NRRL Y-12639) TaxID=1071378 RepID=G0WBN1_NAUDC|nr:hypothetical protein NDAI_0E03340 [Naumovozyma dairenensis CBS 421]CCD25151.1 hypothetical protein NDAI_0E03340 [Naumovozyma dairenensis CBS 421]
MSKLLYTFVETALTNALIIFREQSQKLVYASLGSQKDVLLKIAEQDFETLSKITKVKYLLDECTEGEKEWIWLEPLREEYTDFMENLGSYEFDKLEIEYLFGTTLQRQIWDEMRKIKPGMTISYGEIAKKINKPKASRAVGRGCGFNKIALIVPCHRVIGSSGKLTGYRWSIVLKKRLLAKEANYRSL